MPQEVIKSPKYPCFHGYLGLLPLRNVSAKSEKATSLSIFLYTWGFSSFSQEEFVLSSHLRTPQKQQVPLISWLLGAFTTPRRCGRERKSNKYPFFPIYLGLFVLLTRGIRSVIASTNSSKATSLSISLCTWGFSSFSQEEFLLASHLRIPQKQQVPVISWLLGAFAAPGGLRENSFRHSQLR